jgi:hypothetical protein
MSSMRRKQGKTQDRKSIRDWGIRAYNSECTALGVEAKVPPGMLLG